MTVPVTVADTEAAARTWARQASLIVAQVGQRTFFTAPDSPSVYPIIEVSRLGGAPQLSADLEDVRLTWRIWAQNKQSANTTMRALVSELQALDNQLLDPGTWCYGGTVDSITWAPDNTAKLASYVVDCTLTVRVA